MQAKKLYLRIKESISAGPRVDQIHQDFVTIKFSGQGSI